eukprot:jgi/Botrbrau1/23277/Bobra.0102s0020.1
MVLFRLRPSAIYYPHAHRSTRMHTAASACDTTAPACTPRHPHAHHSTRMRPAAPACTPRHPHLHNAEPACTPRTHMQTASRASIRRHPHGLLKLKRCQLAMAKPWKHQDILLFFKGFRKNT